MTQEIDVWTGSDFRSAGGRKPICQFCREITEFRYNEREDVRYPFCKTCGVLACIDCGTRFERRPVSSIGKQLGGHFHKYCPSCDADDTPDLSRYDATEDASPRLIPARAGKTRRDLRRKMSGGAIQFRLMQTRPMVVTPKRQPRLGRCTALMEFGCRVTVQEVQLDFNGDLKTVRISIQDIQRIRFPRRPDLDEAETVGVSRTHETIWNPPFGFTGLSKTMSSVLEKLLWERLYKSGKERFSLFSAVDDEAEIGEPSTRPRKHKPRARYRYPTHRVAYAAAEVRAVYRETGDTFVRGHHRGLTRGSARNERFWCKATKRTDCPQHRKSDRPIAKGEHIRSLRAQAEQRREEVLRVRSNAPVFNDLLLRIKYDTADQILESWIINRYERALSDSITATYSNLFALEQLEVLQTESIILRDDVFGSLLWMEEDERELVRRWRKRQQARLARLFPQIKPEDIFFDED